MYNSNVYMFPLAYYLKYYWSGASSPCSGLEGHLVGFSIPASHRRNTSRCGAAHGNPLARLLFVSLSLVDRCCAVSSHVGTRGVVGGVDVEDGARRRAGGAGVRARGDDLRKHHTGFLLNGRGVGVDVNPPDAAVVGAASGEAPPQCNQASWCRAEAL